MKIRRSNLTQKSHNRSFTLVELMVAMAISALIAVAINQVFSASTRIIKNVSYKNSATAEARFIFDRLARDFSKMPLGKDFDYQLNPQAEGTKLQFFSKIRGLEGDRRLSVISYRTEEPQKRCYRLLRAIKGVDWADAGYMGMDTNGLTVRFSDLPQKLIAKNKDYELISDNLIKMDISFQRKSDGELIRELPAGLQGSSQITNVASVVITLAMLDAGTVAKTTPSEVKRVAERLTVAPDRILTFSHWSTNLITINDKGSDALSSQVARQTMLFQRFYRIGTSP